MRVKKLALHNALLLLVVVMALPCMAATNDPVGYVQTAEGEVEVVCTDGEVKAAAYDLPIMASDTIKTGEASAAQVMFIDKTVLALSENTEVGIVDVYTPDKGGMFNMHFLAGTARIITSDILGDNPDKFQAVTPLGTIGIRGTELGLLADPDHEVVMLYEGGPAMYTDMQALRAVTEETELCTSLAKSIRKVERAYKQSKLSIDIVARRKLKKQLAKLKDYQQEYQCAP